MVVSIGLTVFEEIRTCSFSFFSNGAIVIPSKLSMLVILHLFTISASSFIFSESDISKYGVMLYLETYFIKKLIPYSMLLLMYSNFAHRF